MADVQKYSLIDSLNSMDEKYTGDLSLLGISALTVPAHVNSMRTTMLTSHIRQYLTPLNPEFPFLFMNSENVVGEYSGGYKKAKHDMKVIKKIVKYGDILENPISYLLFVFDEEKQKFDVIKRKEVEDLTENFGYQYNNKVLDTFDEGDVIDKGTILYKSSSYDEDMNFSYGKNVCTMFTLDPYTAEDAATVSESLANEFLTIEPDTISINLNDNDYLLNMYGNKKHYKTIPDIGETFVGFLAAYRRFFKNQILFDFSDKSLMEIHDGDQVIYAQGKHQVLDIDIFYNSEELVESPFMDQINGYIRSQEKYYQEIKEVCEDIMNSGYEYTNDVEYMYKRSIEMLDKKKRWKEGDSAFSNIVINVLVKKVVPLSEGQKITGRYGNKSVISKVVADDQMPFTEDGRRVDLKINVLAIPNRTIAQVIIETCITAFAYQLRKYMKTLKTYKEKEDILFDFLHIWNSEQEKEFYKDYKKLSKKEQKNWIDAAISDGIYLHQQPLWDETPVFYRIRELMQHFDFLQPENVYIRKWGRVIKTLSKRWIGYMYCIKLKQSDRRGFSVRSTGAIDTKSLPTRSYKSKAHKEKYSSTAVRFGEFESLNFSIGIIPDDLALFHLLYRTSLKGRKDLLKMMFKVNDSDDSTVMLDDSYTSRVAEIFNVIMKSLGVEVIFKDDDNELLSLSTENIDCYTIDDITYFCTEYEAFLHKRISEITKEVLSEKGIITTEELNNEVERIMRERKYITGSLYDKEGNLVIK